MFKSPLINWGLIPFVLSFALNGVVWIWMDLGAGLADLGFSSKIVSVYPSVFLINLWDGETGEGYIVKLREGDLDHSEISYSMGREAFSQVIQGSN